VACRGEFNPARSSDETLLGVQLAQVPETGTTTKATVERTIELRRDFFEKNYPGFRDVKPGRGFGVTISKDVYGDRKLHRTPDWAIVVIVEKRSQCRDADAPSLFVFGDDGVRVPVRFRYIG